MSFFSQAGGFRPCRNISGGSATLKTFAVSAASDVAYFIGDAVTMGANGKVKLLRNATTAAPLGVIQAVMRDSGGKPMPLTLTQPTNGPFLTSGQAGFAMVNIDGNQTYVVEIDANITDAAIGVGAKVSAGAPNTRAGISGQELSATLAVSADAHFQVIGLAPVEFLVNRASAASTALVEVKLMRSTFNGNPV
jgi:hypothetical protein